MGLDRRAFIGLVAGGAVGTLFTPIPWKLADDAAIWSQNWPWIPRNPKGQVDYVTTSSKLSPSGEGLKIMRVAGQPILAQGNPDHPLSQGAISPLGRAEAYMLYSPSRVKTPMRKAGNKFEPITWEEALSNLSERIKAAKGKVAAISGDQNGTANEVLSAFVKKAGGKDCFLMPTDARAAAVGFSLMGGQGQVGYDLDNADLVVVLGADLMESFGPTVRNGKAYGQGKAEYVYVGPSRNGTAAISSAWIPATAGGLGAVAMGLVKLLLDAGAKADGVDGIDALKKLAGDFTPEKVKAASGLDPAALTGLAKKLAAAKAPLVIVGSPAGQGLGAGPFMAGMAANLLLGRLNKPGGVFALPEAPAVFPDAMARSAMQKTDLVGFLKAVEAGKTPPPDVLLCYAANPAYGLPEAKTMAKALEKIPFKVSFASFMDETAMASDMILPSSLTLERFDDVATPFGTAFCVYSLCKPVLAPIFDTKSTPDFLLAVAKKAGFPLGFDTFEQALKEKAAVLAKAGGFLTKDAAPWKVLSGEAKPQAAGADLYKALLDGAAWAMVGQVAQTALSFKADILAKALAPKPVKLALAPYAMGRMGTPATGIPAQNLTTIPDTELMGNDTFVKLNAETARTYGFSQGNTVKLSAAGGECKARVRLCEAVMTGVVAVPLGYGHTAFDEFSKGKGDNYLGVLAAAEEQGTGLYEWAGPEASIA